MHARILSGNLRKLHDQTHYSGFMTKYTDGSLKLRDHYCHLFNLKTLYFTLEQALQSVGCTDFHEDLRHLLVRSMAIQKDLDYLQPHVSHHQNIKILPSIEAYVAHIKKIAAGKNKESVLAHFLLRIYGDLHGGQKTKNKTEKIYQKHKLSDCHKGLNFQTFEKDDLGKLMAWDKNQDYQNLDAALVEMGNGFQRHLIFFEELGKRQSTCSQFFNHKKAIIAVTATVLGIATTAYAFAKLG